MNCNHKFSGYLAGVIVPASSTSPRFRRPHEHNFRHTDSRCMQTTHIFLLFHIIGCTKWRPKPLQKCYCKTDIRAFSQNCHCGVPPETDWQANCSAYVAEWNRFKSWMQFNTTSRFFKWTICPVIIPKCTQFSDPNKSRIETFWFPERWCGLFGVNMRSSFRSNKPRLMARIERPQKVRHLCGQNNIWIRIPCVHTECDILFMYRIEKSAQSRTFSSFRSFCTRTKCFVHNIASTHIIIKITHETEAPRQTRRHALGTRAGSKLRNVSRAIWRRLCCSVCASDATVHRNVWLAGFAVGGKV